MRTAGGRTLVNVIADRAAEENMVLLAVIAPLLEDPGDLGVIADAVGKHAADVALIAIEAYRREVNKT